MAEDLDRSSEAVAKERAGTRNLVSRIPDAVSGWLLSCGYFLSWTERKRRGGLGDAPARETPERAFGLTRMAPGPLPRSRASARGTGPSEGRLARGEPRRWRPRGGCGFGLGFVGASPMRPLDQAVMRTTRAVTVPIQTVVNIATIGHSSRSM